MKNLNIKCLVSYLFLIFIRFSFAQQWAETQISNEGIYSIDFINSNTGCVLVGPNNPIKVYKTTNKGASFFEIGQFDIGSIFSIDQFDLNMVNSNKIFFYLRNKIYRTDDGGLNWTENVHINDWPTLRACIKFRDQNFGIFTYVKNTYEDGSRIFRTTNGGNTWSEVVHFPTDYSGYHAVLFEEIEFLENNKINIIGYRRNQQNTDFQKRIAQSINDGDSWNMNYDIYAYSTSYNCASYFNSNNFNILGIIKNYEPQYSDGLYLTKYENGSISGIYKISSTLYNLPVVLRGLKFKDANTGYAMIANTIYKTENAGVNWQTIHQISEGSYYPRRTLDVYNDIIYSCNVNYFHTRILSSNLLTNHDNIPTSGSFSFDGTQYNTPSTHNLRGGTTILISDNVLNSGQSNEKIFYKWNNGNMYAGTENYYFDTDGSTISSNYKTKFLSTVNTAISHSPQTKAIKDTIINGNGTVHQIHESMGGIIYSRSTNNGTSFSREEVVNLSNFNTADGNKNASLNITRWGSGHPYTTQDANRNVIAAWERYNSATGKVEIKVANRRYINSYYWQSYNDAQTNEENFASFTAPAYYESKPKIFSIVYNINDPENLNTHVILVPHIRPNGSQNKIIVTVRYSGQVQDFEIDNGNISDLAVTAPYNGYNFVYGLFDMHFAYKKDNKIAYKRVIIGKETLGLYSQQIESNENISAGDHASISHRYTPDISIMNNVPVVTYLGYYGARRDVVYEEFGTPEHETIALNYYPVIKIERNPDTGVWERRNIYNSNGFNTQQNPNVEGSKTTKSYLLNFSINNNTHKQFVGVAGSNGNYQAGYVVNPGIFYGTDAKLMRGSYEGLTGANSDPSLLTLSPESPLYRVGKRSLTITNNQVYDLDNFNNMVGVVEIEGVTYGFNLGPIIVKGSEINYEISKEPEAIQTAIDFNDNLRSEPFLLNENDTLLLGTSAVYLPIEYMPPYFQTIKYDVNLINKETDELHRILFSGEITQEDSVEIEFLRGFIINDINNGSDSFYVKIDVDPEDINGADIYAVNFGINPNDDSGGDNPGSNGKIKIVFENGNTPANISNNIPDNYSLSQNYPNPFNPVTKISFDLPKDGLVKLMIYDITGRLISTLVNEMKTVGSHNVTFDGSSFSSGVYFYRLEATGFVQTRRMLMVK